MKILHIAGRKLNQRIWTRQFRDQVSNLGQLELVEDGLDIPPARRAEMIRQAKVLLTG